MSYVVYSLIKSKSNRKVFSVNFEDLKKHLYKGTVYCLCPYCKEMHEEGNEGYRLDPDYNKYKLALKDDEVGRCNRCNNVFVNETDIITLKLPQIKLANLDIDAFPIVSLPDIKSVKSRIRKASKDIEWAIHSRNPFTDIQSRGMGTFNFYEDRPNIYTPIEYENELVYYQLRFLDGEEPKYYMPGITHKPIYIPKGIPLRNKIVIAEGTYDVNACIELYPDRTPIGVLGSYISPYQIGLIRSIMMVTDVLIHMDMTYISEGIAKSIIESPMAYYLEEIKVVESEGMDPEELLRQKHGIVYDEKEIIKKFVGYA